MKLSLLIPSRNNVEFLKLCYSSIRKNQGNHFVEILVLDDKSDKDTTWEWCLETMKLDSNFKAFKNERKERLGISSGFKFLSQQATQDVIGHFHADMFMIGGTLDEIEKELFVFYEDFDIFDPISGKKTTITDRKSPNNKKVVCLTRIEPPIYDNPGLYPEKIIWKDAPIEIEDWDEQKILDFLPDAKKLWNDKRTGGHFVPFFMFRDEYLKLGGNDIDNFPKQAREDSDFAFRLVLADYNTIQIPTFVYHFASRGNRRSKDNNGTWQDSEEWQIINRNSERNFIRKWQTFHPLHDAELSPRRPKVYNIGFKVENLSVYALYFIEPWCKFIQIHNVNDARIIEEYIQSEQINTTVNLFEKFSSSELTTDIIVEFNCDRLFKSDLKLLEQLSMILEDSGEIGKFKLGNLNITVKSLQTYEQNLIICKNTPISLNETN